MMKMINDDDDGDDDDDNNDDDDDDDDDHLFPACLSETWNKHVKKMNKQEVFLKKIMVASKSEMVKDV